MNGVCLGRLPDRMATMPAMWINPLRAGVSV